MNSWQPLLDGPLAQRTWEAVDEITAVLTEASGEAALPPDAHPSVAGGMAGRALYFAYLSRAGGNGREGQQAAADAAAELLDRSTDALATTPLLPDLYGGFTGVAWTAEHLYSPRFADEPSEAAGDGPEPGDPSEPSEPNDQSDQNDPLIEIDQALDSFVSHTPWVADYDLIRGLTGLGIYALERLPRPSALACLAKIVARLDETAERSEHGITWHTSPDLLPDWQRQIYANGYYNLGVAHGVPGTIAVLGAAAAATRRIAATAPNAGHAPNVRAAAAIAAKADELVHGAVRWLMTQRLPAGEESWFAGSMSPEVKPVPSRLAWCYGDPGIAATLLVAARACGEPEWERFAVELGIDAARRSAEGASRLRDAGLCHGFAGIAHLFNRLYQTTGEPELAAAGRRWFEATLEFRQPGAGLAGFRAFAVDEKDMKTHLWRSDPGFLEGIAGIGLALVGGLSDFDPSWDRVLALSAAT